MIVAVVYNYVVGNMVQINYITPTCKLDQIGACNSTLCQSVFLEEESNTLFTLSADHIIRYQLM